MHKTKAKTRKKKNMHSMYTSSKQPERKKNFPWEKNKDIMLMHEITGPPWVHRPPRYALVVHPPSYKTSPALPAGPARNRPVPPFPRAGQIPPNDVRCKRAQLLSNPTPSGDPQGSKSVQRCARSSRESSSLDRRETVHPPRTSPQRPGGAPLDSLPFWPHSSRTCSEGACLKSHLKKKIK